jgi:hypothetical protein
MVQQISLRERTIKLLGEEDANVGIGAALGDDLEIPNDNDHVEDEIDENEDHMEDDFPEFGLNNIIDI